MTRLHRIFAALTVAFTLALLAPAVSATSLNPFSEYKIKAAYLYNFTKFIEWPPAAFAQNDAPFVIGVLEHDAAASQPIASTLSGKTTAGGRRIEVRSARAASELAGCQIVFIARSAAADLPVALEQFRAQSTLLVGETTGFAQSGGVVNFVVANDVVRLEINPQRANRAGLRLSGALASVALLVRDREDAHD